MKAIYRKHTHSLEQIPEMHGRDWENYEHDKENRKTYPVSGNCKWEDGEIVEEGKFELKYQVLKDLEWEDCSKFHYDNTVYQKRIVAIPIQEKTENKVSYKGYCPRCDIPLLWQEITNDEKHSECGAEIKWIEENKKVIQEEPIEPLSKGEEVKEESEDLPEFLFECKNVRNDFVRKAQDDWWMKIGLDRVVFEDILIMYDQMQERLTHFSISKKVNINMDKNVITDSRIKICEMIAEDMKNDAYYFEGRPFTGQTVAEYFGNHGAAIAALANVLKSIIEDNLKIIN